MVQMVHYRERCGVCVRFACNFGGVLCIDCQEGSSKLLSKRMVNIPFGLCKRSCSIFSCREPANGVVMVAINSEIYVGN